jgi:hypothetical protein
MRLCSRSGALFPVWQDQNAFNVLADNAVHCGKKGSWRPSDREFEKKILVTFMQAVC